MREYYKGFITSLEENEVFIFGSNLKGLHGAGTAGLAYRGDSSGWWADSSYQEDGKKLKTDKSYTRVGKWAIFGQSKGFMQGHSGKSYGIATCTRPGAKRSISLEQIYDQLVELNNFARENQSLRFLCTIVGGGYSGYSFEEFGKLYTRLQQKHGIAENIILPESLKKYVEGEKR